MKLTVINDLHLGVQRSGGTTPASAQALRDYTQLKFKELLELGERIVINGDMFDTHQVPTSDLLYAYITVAEWLNSKGQHLFLIPGNHDLSKNSANLSSFELLARLLMSQYPDKVSYHVGGTWIDEPSGVYAVSHVANQELFELALSNVPDSAKTLLLHCNFDNKFAGQSDHSLNLDRAQAKELTKMGITLVLGHEHQGRTMMNDKVIIVGNQSPTSVSDCLTHGDGQKDGRKYCLQIDGDDMELIPTWSFNSGEAGGFTEIDWQDLGAKRTAEPGFVRVCGTAEAAQAADVIKAISKFRQNSQDFVVTNGVKVDAVGGMDELAESVEDIRSVNIMDLLLEQLDAEQQAVVRKLLAEAA